MESRSALGPFESIKDRPLVTVCLSTFPY